MTRLDDTSATILGQGRDRALAAAKAAADARGTDIRVLDLHGVTPMFDYFVIATGTSSRQIHAMADDVKQVLIERHGDRPRGTEGYEEGRWIVLDYGDVVVHLFDAESRAYWDLEGLWSDARPVAVAS
jgi:ribosome-associated protein